MKTAIYQINYACNQNCQFCLNEWGGKNVQEIDLTKKLRIIKKLKDLGVTNLTISGGEPMLDRDFKEIVKLASKLNMKVLIQTNGTRIDEEMTEFLKENNVFLEISLEGTEEIHNSVTKSKNFKAVITGIKNALNVKIPVCTNFTITKLNIKNLNGYLQLLKDLDIKLANFTKMYPSGNALININIMPSEKENIEFLKQLANNQNDIILNVQPGFKKNILKEAGIILSNSCTACKEISISPDGSVKPCPSWPIKYGNILSWYEMPEIEADGCAIEEMIEAKVNKPKKTIIEGKDGRV